jgi:hypothetical protein
MDFISGMIKMLPEGLVSALGDFGSVISKFGGAILGVGVLLGMIAVGAKLFEGAMGLMGKGLSVLGVTTLPAYISKYVVVNRALDSFTAALLRASVAAKAGGNSTIISDGGGMDLPDRNKKNPPTTKGGRVLSETAGSNRAERLKTVAEGRAAQAAAQTPELSRKEQFYNVGRAAGKVLGKGGAAGIASIVTDQIAGALGSDTVSGKLMDTLSTGLMGFSTGAMTMNPWVAAAGGVLGLGTGVYKNFFSDNATPISGDITSQAASGDNPVLKAQLAQIEQQKKQNDQMAEMINEQSRTNQLAAMGLGKDDDLARRVSNISFNA